MKLELGARVSPAEISVGDLRDRILATRPASAKVVTRKIWVCSVLQRHASQREAMWTQDRERKGTNKLALLRARDDERAPFRESILQRQLPNAFRVQPVVQIVQLRRWEEARSARLSQETRQQQETTLTSSSSS